MPRNPDTIAAAEEARQKHAAALAALAVAAEAEAGAWSRVLAATLDHGAARDAFLSADEAEREAARALDIAERLARYTEKDRPHAARCHRWGARIVRTCGPEEKRAHKRIATRRERHEARATERAARIGATL